MTDEFAREILNALTDLDTRLRRLQELLDKIALGLGVTPNG
jgi:hypothetical protein